MYMNAKCVLNCRGTNYKDKIAWYSENTADTYDFVI